MQLPPTFESSATEQPGNNTSGQVNAQQAARAPLSQSQQRQHLHRAVAGHSREPGNRRQLKSGLLKETPLRCIRVLFMVFFLFRCALCLMSVLGLTNMALQQTFCSVFLLAPPAYQFIRVNVLGKEPLHNEKNWFILPCMLVGTLTPTFIFYKGDPKVDFAIGVAMQPIAACLVTFICGCYRICFGQEYNLHLIRVMGVPAACAIAYRYHTVDPDIGWVIVPFLSTVFVGLVMIHALKWLSDLVYISLLRLQRSVAMSESLRKDLEATTFELEDARSAMHCLLTGMCDVMCTLDGTHCFRESSTNTARTFMPETATCPSDLDGHSVFEFVPDPLEKERLQNTLEQQKDNNGSIQHTASCINLQMVNDGGSKLCMAVFHAPMGFMCGKRMHLLGMRVLELQNFIPEDDEDMEDEQKQRRADVIDRTNAAGGGDNTSENAGLMDDGIDGLEEVGQDDSGRIPSLGPGEGNLVAITFDAGSIDFDLLHLHPCIPRTRRTAPNLRGFIPPDLWESFEAWVVDQVQNAAWGSSTTTGLYPNNMAIRVYNQRQVRDWFIVDRVWLSISLPESAEHEDVMQTTVWFQDFCRPRNCLGSVNEEVTEEPDDDEVYPDDSASGFHSSGPYL